MKFLWKAAVSTHTWLYRQLGGRFVGGDNVLLLTTVGRKTGKMRTSPLMKLAAGNDLLVSASAGGSSRHPEWFLNLKDNPNVNVQVGTLVEPRRARVTDGSERDELYQRFVDANPRFGEYQEKTDRIIPVVVLEPVT